MHLASKTIFTTSQLQRPYANVTQNIIRKYYAIAKLNKSSQSCFSVTDKTMPFPIPEAKQTSLLQGQLLKVRRVRANVENSMRHTHTQKSLTIQRKGIADHHLALSPEGIYIKMMMPTSSLVSWQTGWKCIQNLTKDDSVIYEINPFGSLNWVKRILLLTTVNSKSIKQQW